MLSAFDVIVRREQGRGGRLLTEADRSAYAEVSVLGRLPSMEKLFREERWLIEMMCEEETSEDRSRSAFKWQMSIMISFNETAVRKIFLLVWVNLKAN